MNEYAYDTVDSTSDENGAVFQPRVDWSETPPTLAIVDALADIENVDPGELQIESGITLYDYVEPDALDALLTECEGPLSITFVVDHYRVSVDADEDGLGSLEIRPL